MKPPSFSDHFSPISAAYAQYRPTYPAAMFQYLASVAPRTEMAWDCGAGSGQASVSLAERFQHVIATDASADQIACAVQHPRVSYRVARAEASGLPAASVDLVTVAQALHWFDLPAFYAEARRVLRSDGVLAAWVYGGASLDDAELTRVLHDFHYGTLESYWPPGREHAETGYRNLAFPFTELKPRAFEMTADWTAEELLGFISSWSAVRRLREVGHVAKFDAFAEDLRTRWHDPKRRHRITWPLHVRVGRV